MRKTTEKIKHLRKGSVWELKCYVKSLEYTLLHQKTIQLFSYYLQYLSFLKLGHVFPYVSHVGIYLKFHTIENFICP